MICCAWNLFWQNKGLPWYFQYRLPICWFDARETYSQRTKDLAWYFQYRLIVICLLDARETYSGKTKDFLGTFNIDCDLLIWCTRNLFWQNKGLPWCFQYRLLFVEFMHEKLILTEQRTSLDTFNCDLLIWCARNLFWQNKGLRLIVAPAGISPRGEIPRRRHPSSSRVY